MHLRCSCRILPQQYRVSTSFKWCRVYDRIVVWKLSGVLHHDGKTSAYQLFGYTNTAALSEDPKDPATLESLVKISAGKTTLIITPALQPHVVTKSTRLVLANCHCLASATKRSFPAPMKSRTQKTTLRCLPFIYQCLGQGAGFWVFSRNLWLCE